MRVKVFLDTSVIMDLLVAERSTAESQSILSAVKQNIIEAHISTQSLLDAYYSSLKYHVPFEVFKGFIQDIREYVNVGYIDSFNIDWAIQNYSGDYEDDAQYACAYDASCDYFVTRDNKLHNRNSGICPLTVITPEDFVAQMR